MTESLNQNINMSADIEGALARARRIISRAIAEGDTRTLDFYHTFINLVETHELRKKLIRMNIPALRNIINYLDEKEKYLQEKISEYEISHDLPQ